MPLFGKSRRKKDRPPISGPTVVKVGNRVVDDADRLSPIRGSVEDLRKDPSPVEPSTPTLRTRTVTQHLSKGNVSQMKQFYELKSSRPDSTLSSPSQSSSRPPSQISTSDVPPIAKLDKSPFHSSAAVGKTSEVSLTFSFDEPSPSQKRKESLQLQLPPLTTSSRGGKRKVVLTRKPQGGFGIKLSLSAIPDPTATNYSRMGFLIEPRSDTSGRDVPLVTGDVLLTVNGIPVEGLNYDSVVDLIKTAGQSIIVEVACLPELIELSERGALEILDEAMSPEPAPASSVPKGRGHTTGTLRRARSKKQREQFRARTVDEVMSEKAAMDSDRMWLVHKDGYTAVRVLPMRSTSRSNPLAIHTIMVRTHGRDTKQVKLEGTEEIMDVAEEDLEKANPSNLDRAEDLTDLVHLNEPSVVHVLRQRYANSLVHTYAGRHTIIINPIRQLASYSDKVLEMFHGGRREDMPPHIFAIAQQAYHSLITDHRDQSLVLMGLSGAGKTFNARHLLRYLATAGGSAVDMHTTLEKFQAAFILLRSFGSAATYLNPESTRFTGVYTVEYDALGSLQGATFKGYLLEKVRVAQRPAGESVFNIFHNLLVGADAKLQSDLQLDIPVGDSTNAYINLDQHGDKKQRESAAKVWAVLKNCITVLGIAAEEEKALWSLLAAIYHLGYAAVKRSEKMQARGGDRFMNPAASQRAAAVLGISHEDLGHFIFSPPRGVSMRITSNTFGATATSPGPADDVASQSPSITSLMGGSPFLGRSSGWDALSSFCMGLYEQAFNALVLLINRSLQPSSGSVTKKHKIHVLDPPGMQDITLSEHRTTATFDELCDNYAMERLQMLFHDSTFTAEQERYIQEEIQYSFSDVVSSPLPVIDVIDRNVPMRRGAQMDLSTDKRGLLWILDEESIFPGATDGSFMERLQIYHGTTVEEDRPETSDHLVTINKDNLQFTIRHCHRSLPVAYDVSGWVRQARDHPSYRVVPQVLNESKRNYIASVFQGRGVAAAVTMLSASSLKQDARRQSLQKLSSFTAVAASAGVKKSSVCLQTKFQLDSIIDELRKSNQWFIHCLLPHLPHQLPHALGASAGEVDKSSVYGCLDVPLVWAQLKRSDLVKVARLYKQGFPEHMTFTAFRRRYEGILPTQRRPHKNLTDKQATDMIVERLELKKASLRVGLSQIFFRAGITGMLEQQLEEKTSLVIASFQARCRGYLARRLLEKTEVKYNAACILQRNIRAYIELRDWRWWRVLLQLKPVMAVRKTEEERKELADQTETLKKKLQAVEDERDHLRANEQILEEKLAQVSARLDEEIGTAGHLSEALEQEQCSHRETREKLAQVETLSTALEKVNEDLRVEMAQKDILHRIEHTGEDGIEVTEENAILMEKYRSAQRELEGLRLRLSSEREEDLESLQTAKRNLDKKVAEQEGEMDDLRRTLSQLRKKLQKQASEMNDLQLLLENQQARNEDLEKKQRKFDTELSSFRADATREKDERERIQKEKDRQQSEMLEKEAELRRLREDFHKMKQEKEELELELEELTSRSTSQSEVASLKSLKRELENKVAELEDELDEANMRVESLEQTKSRLDLSAQTAKQNYQKELDAREEEMDKIRSTMNRRVRSLEAALEEEHSEKQAAVKEKQKLDVQLEELQTSMVDPVEEQKLRKQLKKSRALIKDLQQELDYTRESGRNSTALRSLRHKLEEKEDVENSLNKTIKKLNAEVAEVQEFNEDLERRKAELELKVSELTREKNELELRCEEDQDEVEEMAERQRQSTTKIVHLERQLVDAHMQVSELEEQKEKLERDVSELQSHLSHLQAETPRMNDEVVELRIKEMQQKVDMEAATRKRMENQVQRLKNQLEKASLDKMGGNEADKEIIKKYQRQLKDMKEQVKEAEAREQEVTKKKRMADSQVEELEAILEATKQELHSSNNRIKVLQRSLAGDADEEDGNADDVFRAGGSDSDVSAGSYQIGQYGSTDDELDGDLDGEGDEVDKFLKDRRNKRSKKTTGLDHMNDDGLEATEDFGAGRGRRRLDELLAGDDHSPAIKPRKTSDGSVIRGGKTTSDLLADDDDLPVLSSRTRRILDEGSDIEDIPSIKPRKTLEELLRSDSDEDMEDL